MRLVRRLTDFRSDYRDTISVWILLKFKCRFHSSLGAYRLFEIALRQHNYSRAEEICLLSSRRFGRVLDVCTMQCIVSFRRGDLKNGSIQLDACVQSGDFRAVERLLFRTGTRPADLSKRFLVLDRIADHAGVLFSHRCYARIAQSYQVLKLEDLGLAKSLVPSLLSLIAELESTPSVVCCREPNRSNRGKILVSLCTIGYHIALLLRDDNLLEYSSDVAGRFFKRIDFLYADPDACLRMSSNFARCLAIGLLLPGAQGKDSSDQILKNLAQLEASVVEYCLPSQSGRRYGTQENHLALMADLQADLKVIFSRNRSEFQAAIPRLAQLLNHSSSKSLGEVIESRLRGVYVA